MFDRWNQPIDVVVIRDPDSSNEFHTFGDERGQVVTFDLDLGYADLRDPIEFAEWAESRALDAQDTRTGGAAALIASVVREVARENDHPIPDWAS